MSLSLMGGFWSTILPRFHGIWRLAIVPSDASIGVLRCEAPSQAYLSSAVQTPTREVDFLYPIGRLTPDATIAAWPEKRAPRVASRRCELRRGRDSLAGPPDRFR